MKNPQVIPVQFNQFTFVEHSLGSEDWARPWGGKRARTQVPLWAPPTEKGSTRTRFKGPGAQRQKVRGSFWWARVGRTLQGEVPAKTVASKTLRRRLRS